MDGEQMSPGRRRGGLNKRRSLNELRTRELGWEPSFRSLWKTPLERVSLIRGGRWLARFRGCVKELARPVQYFRRLENRGKI